MRRSLTFVLALSGLVLCSFWFAPRHASTQSVAYGPFVRNQTGKATHLYSRAHGQYLPVNDVRPQVAEIARNVPRDKKSERAFLEKKEELLTNNPYLSPDQKKNRIKLLDRIKTRLERNNDLTRPVPEPIDPLDPPDDPPPSDPPPNDPPAETPPTPGGLGFGILYTSSYITAFNGGTAVDYNVVAPQTAGGNNSNFLYLTSTNRSGDGVEAFPAYFAQHNVEFTVFDWSIANHTSGNPFVVVLPFSAFVHNYYTVGICDAPNPPCGGSIPFHFYNVLGLWNGTYQKQAGSSTWTNEVYLLNPANNSWDFIWSRDYQSSLGQEQCSGCGWWGPIVETFQPSYSNMHVMGFANAWAAPLTPGGGWDPNYPDSSFNGLNAFFYGPTAGWQVLSLENQNLANGFLVH